MRSFALPVAALLALAASPAMPAERVDPKVSLDFQKRRALVRSAYAHLPQPSSATSSLPPVGLLGKDQFHSLSATWTQFHRAVLTGNVEVLRTVVRNARACKNDSLALKAETLMESRARRVAADGPAEMTMGERILAQGPKIAPEQIGEAGAPFIVSTERSGRVRFGNVLLVEGEGGYWSVDLGC